MAKLRKEIELDVIDNRYFISKLVYPTYNNDTSFEDVNLTEKIIKYKKGLKNIEVEFDNDDKKVVYKGSPIYTNKDNYLLKNISGKYYLFKIDNINKMNRKLEDQVNENKIKINNINEDLNKHLELKLRNDEFLNGIKNIEIFEKYDSNKETLISKVIK